MPKHILLHLTPIVDSISNAKNEEGELVFCRYIVRNGKRVYPKHGRVFCFRVKK